MLGRVQSTALPATAPPFWRRRARRLAVNSVFPHRSQAQTLQHSIVCIKYIYRILSRRILINRYAVYLLLDLIYIYVYIYQHHINSYPKQKNKIAIQRPVSSLWHRSHTRASLPCPPYGFTRLPCQHRHNVYHDAQSDERQWLGVFAIQFLFLGNKISIYFNKLINSNSNFLDIRFYLYLLWAWIEHVNSSVLSQACQI